MAAPLHGAALPDLVGVMAARSRATVSVVVAFLGDEAQAVAMLGHLAALRLAPGDEAIVADNSGAGVVAGAVATAPAPEAVRIVDAVAERSPGYARNVGAEHASGEWLLFLDADVRPAPALLDDYLAEPVGERVGALAGAIGLGVGANLMVRRAAWDGVGGFHEGVRSGADIDFCWRLERSGWTVLERPTARVERAGPSTRGGRMATEWRRGAARLWLNRAWQGALPRPPLTSPLALAGYALGDNRAATDRPSVPRAGGRALLVATDAFPARSETFVYNEALRLRDGGWRIRVESSSRPRRPERAVAREVEIAYAEDDPPRLKLRDLAWLAGRHPLRCLWDLRQRRRWRREEEVWNLAALAPAARRLARSGERHVHVHFAAGAALNAMRIARLTGVTYSVAAHAYEIFQKPRNLGEKLERASFAVTGCEYNARHLRGVVRPERADRVHLQVVGVDGGEFSRDRPHPGDRTVISVGRLVEKKGFGDLIDAAALLRARGTVGRVLICGDGPLRAELEERIARHGLDGTVELVEGWGAGPVRELLEDADVFALPCVVAPDGDRDSMPVVVKEALAMEVPVVGTDEVGMPEMIRPGWGRLVPPHDPEALAGAIEELLALPASERRAMGARGRKFVLDSCSLDRETAKLEGLILDALPEAFR